MSTPVRNIPTPAANQLSDVQIVRAGKMDIEQLADIFSLGLTYDCSPFLWSHTTEQARRLPVGHETWDILCAVSELWPRHRTNEALLSVATHAYNRTHADSLATATRGREITADVGNIRFIGTVDCAARITAVGDRPAIIAVDVADSETFLRYGRDQLLNTLLMEWDGTGLVQGFVSDGLMFCFVAVDHSMVFQSPTYHIDRREDLIVIYNRLLDMLRFWPDAQPQPQQ
ncbi:hypothetical protein BZA05DRAFT_444732 [Tricharina praecox]|uniref:uncharacterized protein n=1 Tax=Tricharina praecox TaxID=43433 RepID=UPI00221E7C0E|nr:uncharacterized protein BZA05DRAFT_444732 [Tricharina praecox]KAI5852188.1 hypothetical protein BZA05DRAFT_444732 [Tricharina praecox]